MINCKHSSGWFKDFELSIKPACNKRANLSCDSTFALEMNSEQCAICRSGLYGENLKTLTCDPRHVFHEFCIDTWLKSWCTCPLCRSPVDLSMLPTWQARFRSLCNRPVPEELASEAQELGFPDINLFDEEYPIDGSFLGILHLYDEKCVILAQNWRGWIPFDWENLAEDEDDHELSKVLAWMDDADETVVITEDMGPPEGVLCCTVCNKFVTNIEKALAAHIADKHSDNDADTLNDVIKSILSTAE